MKHLLPVIKR